MLFAVYDGFMAETQVKPSDRPSSELLAEGQSASKERQAARALRGSGQPTVIVIETARKDAASHGKFGPTRIGGPSA